MPEPSASRRTPLPLLPLLWLGQYVSEIVAETGRMALFLAQVLRAMSRPPYRLRLLVQQAEFVGFGSLFIVVLTGLFTGAIFSLQSADALSRVGMESMVGSMVMLAVTRELAPVLTALMVTGRVGSAMATELGTMRVSEQIDAMEVMAVDPLQYLIAPRLLASALMMPCLCIVFNMVAATGSYVVAVLMLGIDEGAFMARIHWYVEPSDLTHGLLKATLFGVVLALVGCYKGFHAQGGARGVGTATTQTVVVCSIVIFVLDYVMTAILLNMLPS